jgi:hypothetical protein
MQLQGLGHLGNTVTSSGIELVTLFVAWSFNQLCCCMPPVSRLLLHSIYKVCLICYNFKNRQFHYEWCINKFGIGKEFLVII